MCRQDPSDWWRHSPTPYKQSIFNCLLPHRVMSPASTPPPPKRAQHRRVYLQGLKRSFRLEETISFPLQAVFIQIFTLSPLQPLPPPPQPTSKESTNIEECVGKILQIGGNILLHPTSSLYSTAFSVIESGPLRPLSHLQRRPTIEECVYKG